MLKQDRYVGETVWTLTDLLFRSCFTDEKCRRCCYAVSADKCDCLIALLNSGDEELQAGTSVYYPKCSVVAYKFLVYVPSRHMKAVSFTSVFSLYTSIQSHLTNDACRFTSNRKCEYVG
jgi:hypothetical protein